SVEAAADAPDPDYLSAAFAFQCGLLRCVFGASPFRPTTPLEPSLLGWSDGLPRRLAEAARAGRASPCGLLDDGRLAVLADALEEAGATDHALLAHLRGPGPHVLGCHALEAVLGPLSG